MFKSVQCPFALRCLWYGPEQFLRNHYTKEHPGLLIESPALLRLKDEKVSKEYLLIFDGSNFILNIEQTFGMPSEHPYPNNLLQFEASISLHFVGNYKSSEEFQYSVQLKHDVGLVEEYSKRINNYTANQTYTKIHCYKLNGRTYYSGRGNTIYPQYYIEVSHCKPTTTSLNLNRAILRELECPSCLEIMQSPIYQCKNSHLLCESCNSKLDVCPTCKIKRTENQNTRNLFAEHTANEMLTSCVYSSRGCEHICPIKDLQNHEDTCQFGIFECPIKPEECKWKGPIKAILAHVEQIHKDNLLENEHLQVVVPCEVQELLNNDEDCFVFQTGGNVFRLLFQYESCTFFWTVQLIGPSDQYDLFKYVLTVVSPDEEMHAFKASRHCLPFTSRGLVKQWLKFPSAADMVDANGNLTYNIKIVKI